MFRDIQINETKWHQGLIQRIENVHESHTVIHHNVIQPSIVLKGMSTLKNDTPRTSINNIHRGIVFILKCVIDYIVYVFCNLCFTTNIDIALTFCNFMIFCFCRDSVDIGDFNSVCAPQFLMHCCLMKNFVLYYFLWLYSIHHI